MLRRLGLIVFASAVLGGGNKPAPPKMPPPSVGVITVQEQPVQLTAELPGRTDPYAVSEVRPQVGGIVQNRLFTRGSTVKAGQPLYQIDPAPYRAELQSAEASLASLKTKSDR